MQNNLNETILCPDASVDALQNEGSLKSALKWVSKQAQRVLMAGAVCGTLLAAQGCKQTDEQKCFGDEQGKELSENLEKREKSCRGALETLDHDKGDDDKRARARSVCFAYGNTLKSQKERARFKENAAASSGDKSVEGACRSVRAKINGRIITYEGELHPKALYIDPK